MTTDNELLERTGYGGSGRILDFRPIRTLDLKVEFEVPDRQTVDATFTGW